MLALLVLSFLAIVSESFSFQMSGPAFRLQNSKRFSVQNQVKMVSTSPSEVQNSGVGVSSSASGGNTNKNNVIGKNLKRGLGEELPGLLKKWNELKGLSEKQLLSKDNNSIGDKNERTSKSLALAYRRCEYVTRLFSKTFYTGTSLMPRDARKHVWAIYAWCRRTDDLVDSPRALSNIEILAGDLKEWEYRLDRIWANEPVDIFELAMADTVQKYPGLSIVPYQDMIKGMIMDVPGMGQERYQTFDDLYLYCYRVAGTVGVMTLPILGTAPGYTEKEALEPALALGIALQLTNILRDVGEDLERGRIYLPQDELARFGLTDDDLFSCEVSEKYITFMKFQIARARDYYKQAERGIPMLSSGGRLAVKASLDLYSEILAKIEKNGYDNFRKRAYTSKLEKLAIVPKSAFAVMMVKKD